MLTASASDRVRATLSLLMWAACCTTLHAQIDFNRQVRPILAENCFQCHGPDAKRNGTELRQGGRGLERHREGPVEIQAALSVNHCELFRLRHGLT
ncbi:MAG TPA: hypothetical protein VGM98_06720 [Schlesneria sp.]